jgi:O-antigen/teichoic acid export membrane protein
MGAATSIGLALLGFGYLSLAWGSVASVACTFAMVQLWRPEGLPFFPAFKAIRKVLAFGSLSSLVMTLNDLAKAETDLIIGRLSGMATVGFFSRASGLVGMFDALVMRALWDVAFPHFSMQSQSDASMKDAFLRAVTLVTAVAWPFFLTLGLLSEPTILTIYGPQWLPSVVPLRVLCFGLIMTAPFLLLSSLMIAMRQMRQNLYQLLVRVPVLGGLVYLAAPHGLQAIGFAFAGAALVDMVVDYLQCRNVLGVTLRDMRQALCKSAYVAFLTSLGPLAMFVYGADLFGPRLWLQIIFGGGLALAAWLAGIFLFRHPLRTEIGHSVISAREMIFARTGA